MTSTKNSRELDRLRDARTTAGERFTRQLRLLHLMQTTAAELEKVRVRWNAQLAALATLAGSAAAAAELAALPKADIYAAVKDADQDAVTKILDATRPQPRRTRRAVTDPTLRPASAAAGTPAAAR